MRCRVCAADVPDDAARCPSCSAALGAHDPCPHCRAQAGASPHDELRAVCDVCGGPRIPRLDRAIQYGGRELPLLRKAEKARKARAGWRAAAIASGLFLPLILLFFVALLAVFGMKLALVATALFALLPVGGFVAYAATQASARGREIAPALDAAWLSAAIDIAAQCSDPLTAASLSKKLGIEEPQAEELIALLDVNDAMGGTRRVRVAAPPAAGSVAAAPTELAEAEALAAEQQAADESAQRKDSA